MVTLAIRPDETRRRLFRPLLWDAEVYSVL
jgi:hypothetical protein